MDINSWLPMTCDQNSQSGNTAFSLLEKGVMIRLLLKSVEDCLLTLKSDMISMFPELANHSDTIIERFYDGELSHLCQIAIAKSPIAGLVTFHDENARPINLLKRKQKKGLDRQVDLGIRLNYARDRILVIEGKRLHSKGDNQYVSGNTGGICRFKREQHGEELEKACIVGFMETEDFSFWHRTINHWIGDERTKSPDLKWNDEEFLAKLEVEGNILLKAIQTMLGLPNRQLNLSIFGLM
ncbi:MAG: hypothetical protein IPM82_28435 [Saprospiraceae bacterium]|nr:hypothetical protein [Saprospiraceae bacterium]